MFDEKKIVALIPARGGSKGVKRKNLRLYQGKTLLAHTIEQAKASSIIDRIVVSSEDEEIIQEACANGADVPFFRPYALASDETSSHEVVLHALSQLPYYDYIILLQVTSPLRNANDIDACFYFCLKQKAPACVSIVESDVHPFWLFEKKANHTLKPMVSCDIPLRRQDITTAYLLNGAIYIAACNWFLQNKSFFSPETVGYVMPKERSLDIDTEHDFQRLESLRDGRFAAPPGRTQCTVRPEEAAKRPSRREDKPQLIFLFPYPITAWDRERCGFDFLLEKGFQLKVFDLSQLMSCDHLDNSNLHFQAAYIIKIDSYQALDTAIKTTVAHAIYIDCVNGINGFQWHSRKLFRLLKRYHASYYVVEIGALPVKAVQNKKPLIQQLKKAANIKRLVRFLRWKFGNAFVNALARYFKCYQLPDKIFCGHTEMINFYLKKYALDSTSVIAIHSFDYDRYLLYNRHKTTEYALPSRKSENKFCVFLDQALTHHRDFRTSGGFFPVTEKAYQQSINRFFDKIENETNLQVIIAASPRASEPVLRNIFGNREIVCNTTLELVAQSELVLMHNSTAVSFAVLFSKPILLIKTSEMMQVSGFTSLIDNMAHYLGLKPICIDDEKEFAKLPLHFNTHSRNRYDSYLYKYIKTKGLEDKTTWEIVAENIEWKKKQKHGAIQAF